MDEPSSPKRQQTIKLAIDSETGELIASEALLELSEAEFTGLRREAMAARLVRRRSGTTMRFQCAICRGPLYLSRRIRGWQNRWFAHDGPAEHCPWYESKRLTPDQVKALVYRGQQEGLAHREAKQFIASWLATSDLVILALNMALMTRRPESVIHHCDQGSQHTSIAFGNRCKEMGVRPSMGSVGDAYDNAMVESFFATMECELIAGSSWKTKTEARLAVFTWIESWYNPR